MGRYLLLFMMGVQAMGQDTGVLKAGFGAADITPPAGAQLPGGFFKQHSKGVRDPLWVEACVVSDGKTPVALVGIDALFVGKALVQSARAQIEKSTGIPGSNVLVGASHTHQGGPIMTCLGSDEDAAYSESVARAVAAAVEQAWKSLQPAEIGIGTGREDMISFNRRFLMRDGREITHPGKPGTKHHAEIVAPAGPIDPDVGVLAVRIPGGKVRGVVVNFSCHATVMGGDRYSADSVGALRRHVRARFGEETAVVFLAGPSGDVTQVDNRSTAKEFGPEHTDMMGAKLAAETARTVARMAWLKEAPVACASESVTAAIRPEPDPDRERPPFGLGSGEKIESVFAEERHFVAEERARTPEIPCEVQAIRIGPLGIVANGAEYFVGYGLRIKEASPFKPTWVVSLANDYVGYVPTPQAFVSGGYEPRTARSSKLAVDTGQKILEGSLKTLSRLQ
jgi:hypothetical protein